MKYPPIHYHDYLKLAELLGSQKLRSTEFGKTAHDELLFITVHQTYELWFKQMIFELSDALKILRQEKVLESEMGRVVARLERIVKIQSYINGQVDILETMTALDFLDFREYLYPASGFQSFQWRCLEVSLGLEESQRLAYNESHFSQHLKPEDQVSIREVMQSPSLFTLVEKWLERTPFVQTNNYVFWESYKTAVHDLFERDLEVIATNPRLTPEDQDKNTKMLKSQLLQFESLFSDGEFEKLKQQKYFRLSRQAVFAALFIQLYRDQPLLQMPFRLIQSLIDLDECMTQWRYRHSQMVHRMLGKKIGTGGSSGHDYLKTATDHHKIFSDFFNLTTFLIPRSMIPKLPPEIESLLNYSN